MFRNRHVVIALLVAPLLSVLAWFAVGRLTGEQPAPAQRGADYPLVEKSSCRWASGFCELANEDFTLRLRVTPDAVLEVRSAYPLEGLLVSIADPGADAAPPESATAADATGLFWALSIARPGPRQRIRVVAAAGGSRYYGEASSSFAQPPDNAGAARQ